MGEVRALRSTNDERIKADSESWLAYENDAKARAVKGSIFSKSNTHLPLTGMIVDYFLNLAEDELADQPPFFAFKPVGKGDNITADAYNHYYNWKVDTKGGASQVLRDGLTSALVQRALILKATHHVDKRVWVDRDRRVLIDLATGKPVLLPDGNPVIEGEHRWVEMPDPVAEEAAQIAMSGGGAPAEPLPTRTHLEADPTVIWDETRMGWQLPTGGLKRSEILYSGSRSEIVPSDRFLCPVNVASPDDAKLVAELYDKDIAWIEDMWIERPWAIWEEVKGEFTQSGADEKTEGESKAKEDATHDDKESLRKIIECWGRRDVLGLEGPQEFVIFIDEDSERAVFYEFTAKVCPDFKRPFTTIAVGRTRRRWWGKSIPEKVAQYQEKIDENFNGEAYRNLMNANPLKGVNPDATVEEEEDLVFDPEKVYHLKLNKKMEDFVSFAKLPDADFKTRDIAQFVFWFVQRWLHISDVGTGDYEALPENNTATGIEINREASQSTSRRWNRRINEGYCEHLLKSVQITMATMPENARETYRFTDGNDIITGTVTADQIRNVEMDVRLVLARRYNAQELEKSERVEAIVDKYFLTPDPLLRMVKRPVYIEMLERLGERNGDRLLPIINIAPPPAPDDGTGQGGQP